MGPTKCRSGSDSQIDSNNELDPNYLHRRPFDPGRLVVVGEL